MFRISNYADLNWSSSNLLINHYLIQDAIQSSLNLEYDDYFNLKQVAINWNPNDKDNY